MREGQAKAETRCALCIVRKGSCSINGGRLGEGLNFEAQGPSRLRGRGYDHMQNRETDMPKES